MASAAVQAAEAIGYRGAGTVEFIVDASDGLRPDRFWFMEMNTRLQVEHPVSEAITGLDFVEVQLLVASGAPLPFAQEDLKINGWAMEARLYAEDPSQDFLPATGNLHHLRFPEGEAFGPGAVRIDSGVCEGDEITPWYDPMIAKVIVHSDSRADALRRLETALVRCNVAGCVTNAGFLTALSRNPSFTTGRVDTNLIARDIEALTAKPAASTFAIGLAAIAAGGLLPQPGQNPWATMAGFRLWGTPPIRYDCW